MLPAAGGASERASVAVIFLFPQVQMVLNAFHHLGLPWLFAPEKRPGGVGGRFAAAEATGR